mmetsp:Transcript_11044/g.34095  ORF Transcript_11044/g.34095 Transcript_11044/m.34095 type:complete len:211 (-) Transcript_11044:1011-1643(-)
MPHLLRRRPHHVHDPRHPGRARLHCLRCGCARLDDGRRHRARRACGDAAGRPAAPLLLVRHVTRLGGRLRPQATRRCPRARGHWSRVWRLRLGPRTCTGQLGRDARLSHDPATAWAQLREVCHLSRWARLAHLCYNWHPSAQRLPDAPRYDAHPATHRRIDSCRRLPTAHHQERHFQLGCADHHLPLHALPAEHHHRNARRHRAPRLSSP